MRWSRKILPQSVRIAKESAEEVLWAMREVGGWTQAHRMGGIREDLSYIHDVQPGTRAILAYFQQEAKDQLEAYRTQSDAKYFITDFIEKIAEPLKDIPDLPYAQFSALCDDTYERLEKELGKKNESLRYLANHFEEHAQGIMAFPEFEVFYEHIYHVTSRRAGLTELDLEQHHTRLAVTKADLDDAVTHANKLHHHLNVVDGLDLTLELTTTFSYLKSEINTAQAKKLAYAEGRGR